MKEIIPFLQIFISILLVASVLLQKGGAAMGSAFGEGEGFHTEKRGSEKFLFQATVVLAVAFIAIAVLNLFL
jgi:preprotein translocase subunit SecG